MLALGAGICGGDIFWFVLWAVRVGGISGVWGFAVLLLVLDLRAGLSRGT